MLLRIMSSTASLHPAMVVLTIVILDHWPYWGCLMDLCVDALTWKLQLRVCSAKKPLALARGKKLHEMRNKGGREAFKKRMKRWKNRKEKRHQMSTGKRPSQEKKLIRAGEKRRLPPPGREQGGGADSHRGKAGREGRGSGKDKGRWEAKKGGKFGKDGNRKARREGLQGSGGGQEGHD